MPKEELGSLCSPTLQRWHQPDKTTSKNREDVERGLGRDRAGGTKPQLAGKKPKSQERGRGLRGHKEWPEMGSFSRVISLDGNKREKRREEEN